MYARVPMYYYCHHRYYTIIITIIIIQAVYACAVREPAVLAICYERRRAAKLRPRVVSTMLCTREHALCIQYVYTLYAYDDDHGSRPFPIHRQNAANNLLLKYANGTS